MSRSAVEELFIQRWEDVVSFVSAFHELEERGIERIEREAVPTVAAWLSERGFELDFDKKYGEFKAYRKEWLNANGDPIVKLVVGGIFPNGIAKVSDVSAPYLWVYVKLEQSTRSSVAEQVRRLVGIEWLDEEVTDRGPLGKYLRQGIPERVQLFSNPSAVADLVIAKFPELLALEETLLKALPSLATSA